MTRDELNEALILIANEQGCVYPEELRDAKRVAAILEKLWKYPVTPVEGWLFWSWCSRQRGAAFLMLPEDEGTLSAQVVMFLEAWNAQP